MSNYNEITNQAAVGKIDGKTIAFYPNLDAPREHAYGEGVEGKIKITIQDYTQGKGDNAKYCSFNLELDDFYYLYEKAKISHMPDPVRRTKIIGWEKEKEGKYAGLSATSKLTITRTPKTTDGKPMNYPWKITIANGYAEAKPGKQDGTFYEGSNTFKVTKEATMNFTDVDFLMKLTKINKYINMFEDIMVKPVFEKGLSTYLEAENERKQRNSYSKNIEREISASAAPVADSQPQNTTKQMTINDAQAQNTNTPELHKMTMVISSEFQYLNENSAVAQCMIKGKAYTIHFPEVDEALLEAQAKQLAITCNLYADKHNRMHFYNMAA